MAKFITCEFSSCDAEMWNGISLFPATSLIFDCTTIKDAEYAIKLDYNNRLAIGFSHFINNYIGIYAPDLPGNSVLVRYIHGNTFETDGGLKDPGNEGMNTTTDDRGYAGIKVHNLGYLPLGTVYGKTTTCFLVEPDPEDVINHFEDLHSGIIAYNTSLEIERTTFKDVMHTAYNGVNLLKEQDDCIYSEGTGGPFGLKQLGLGVGNTDGLTMDNCQNGIQTNALSNILIRQNKMTTPKFGLILSNGLVGPASVHTNNIGAGGIGILANDNLNAGLMNLSQLKIRLEDWDNILEPRAGLWLSSGPANSFIFSDNVIKVDANEVANNNGILCWTTFGSTITDVTVEQLAEHDFYSAMRFENSNAGIVHANLIEGYTVDGWDTGSRGIDVQQSWGTQYTCNSIDNTGMGLFMNFVCDYSPLVNNYFHDHETGLYYNYGASNGPRQANVANQFEGTTYTHAARYDETDPDLALYSGFDVHDDAMPWFPDPLLQGGSWFYYENTLDEPEIICNDLGSLLPDHDDSYLLTIIDTEEYPEVDFKAGRQFAAQWGLYGALIQGSITTTDVEVETWFEDQEILPIGKLYAIHLQAQSPLSSFTTLIADITENIEDKDLITAEYIRKQSEYIDTPDSLWAPIDDSLDIFLDLINIIVEDGIELRHIADSTEGAFIDTLLNHLGTITCESILDSNIQKVLFVQLNSINKHKDTLTSGQKNNLLAVADLCAFEGGLGVSMARTLLKSYGTEDVWSSFSGCTFPSVSSTSENILAFDTDLILSPNPFTNQLHLRAEHALIVSAKLYTSTGVIISSTSWPASHSQLMNLPEVANGVYMLEITDADGNTVVKKLLRQ